MSHRLQFRVIYDANAWQEHERQRRSTLEPRVARCNRATLGRVQKGNRSAPLSQFAFADNAERHRRPTFLGSVPTAAPIANRLI